MATKEASAAKTRRGRRAKAREEDFDSYDAINPLANYKMPWFGWLGLGIMILSEILLWTGNDFIALIFTPVMWTGYILLIDGVIWARGHYSYLRNAKLEWPLLALFSVLIWVMFEVFNFPAQAWSYQNMPRDLLVKGLVFGWAYATIIPALLRTRSLLATFDFFNRSHPWKNFKFTPFWRAVSFITGLALTFFPVMFPGCSPNSTDCLPNLLIPLVWFGFIFMIEPINYRIGAPSVFRDLEYRDKREGPTHDIRELEKRDPAKRKSDGKGKVSFLWQLLAAGLFCGLLWETWNIQAFLHHGLNWDYHLNNIYLLPHFSPEDPWRIGRMPILGFLGYPPFIWECYALWELVKWSMHGDTLWKAQYQSS
jgi:hypothetical protein